ncbi:uncharacterized protein LOC144359872 [Saccoglossus kowalevskii]
MERCFSGLSWKILIEYLDDIIVFARTFEELKRLELVFDRLQQTGLKLKPNKCVLFAPVIELLGHKMSEYGVESDPKKVDATRHWPTTSSVTEVRSFIGLVSYGIRFVRGFAELARPLHDLTKKNVFFDWTMQCQNAFDSLKDALTSVSVLAFRSEDETFILDTDASGCGILCDQKIVACSCKLCQILSPLFVGKKVHT